jgi:hypothetical protein
VARLHVITRSSWAAAYAARAPPVFSAIGAGTIAGASCFGEEVCAASFGLAFADGIACGDCASIVWCGTLGGVLMATAASAGISGWYPAIGER